MGRPHVVILGGGPAGLGAAFRLAKRGGIDVTLLERNKWVGGNASSFEVAGIPVDFGSHRLHPACAPEVLQDIRAMLGEDLLDRSRHGRIRLQGRWIHFPLKPVDLALRLPPRFALGVGADLGRKLMPKRPSSEPESFRSVMAAGLGRTICEEFYFPYARKVWGLDPTDLSAIQAQRRVRAGTIAKMLGKAVSSLPGLKGPSTGRFYYPRHGYGQISQAYAKAAEEAGAEIRLDARVTAVETEAGRVRSVAYEQDGKTHTLGADHIWSTIPITILARSLMPEPPQELLRAAEGLSYRAMILIYLVLDQDRFSEYDAHYFPEPDIALSRMSEPKNYTALAEPRGVTVLCGELPCAPSDAVWQKTDEELGHLMCDSLEAAGIPARATVRQVVARRLRQAYPVYRRGFEGKFDQLDEFVGGTAGLLTFGRQGLYAHDNTHHALHMAYSASDCLEPDGTFNQARWQGYRRVFESNVVED